MATLKIPVGPEDHSQGEESAPISLVEYGDYQCPHCAHAHPIVRRLQQHYGKRLRFTFRNFPLNQIHPEAEIAAETAEFAAANGQFWLMHDALFENQSELGYQFLMELAKSFSLDPQDLAKALEAGTFEPRVKSDFMGGVRSGVNGTPTFFINTHRHNGPFEFVDLVASIETHLL